MFHATDETGSTVIEAIIIEQAIIDIVATLHENYPRQSATDDQIKAIKEREQELEVVIASTSRIIEKHYRKQSAKIHPDRQGEAFRPMFEDFTQARNVLRDKEMRHGYAKEMLEVLKSLGSQYMESSHDSWIDKHRPGEESGLPKASADESNVKKPLTLEGGLHHQHPRAPMVSYEDHSVTVSVHVLRPTHEFYQRVKGITVVFSVTYMEENDTELKKFKQYLKLDRAEIVENVTTDGYATVYESVVKVGTVELPNIPGDWEVSWFAVMDKFSTDARSPISASSETIATPYSAVFTLEVIDPRLLDNLQRFEKYEKACSICVGELENALVKLRGYGPSEPMRRYAFFHETVVRAGKIVRKLTGVMEATKKSSSVLVKLEKALESSRQTLQDLEERKEKSTKKDILKGFKSYIARVLESADPLTLMETVKEEDLVDRGGDSNRLYQLFIEGKGNFQLRIDSDMLQCASARSDLFSSKQCIELAKRKKEVIAQDAKEEEEARAAEAKRQLEEEKMKKLQFEAELGRKWAMVGTIVQLRGLETVKGTTLNGKYAKVVDYLVDKDRFQLQCLRNDDEESEIIALKPDNVSSYDGILPHPSQVSRSEVKATPATTWTCANCAVINGDEGDICNVCKHPRGSLPGYHVKATVEKSKRPTSSQKAKCRNGNHCTRFRDGRCSFYHPEVLKLIHVNASLSERLVGKKGGNIKGIMAKSKAYIVIGTNNVSGELLPVHCIGSADAVQKAIALIKDVIDGEKPISKTNVPSLSVEDSGIGEISFEVTKVAAVEADGAIKDGKDEVAPFDNVQNRAPVSAGMHESKQGEEMQFRSIISSSRDGNIGLSFGKDEGFPGLPPGLPRQMMPTEVDIYAINYEAYLPQSIMDDVLTPPKPLGKTVTSCTGSSSVSSFEESNTSRNNLQRETPSASASPLDVKRHELLEFLHEQQACIKGNAADFFDWLVNSEDIASISDLNEAISDDEYLQDVQQGNGKVGVKGFKRKAFKRSVGDFVQNQIESSFNLTSAYDVAAKVEEAFKTLNISSSDIDEGPRELYCPISHVLMVVDPVIAADSVTYERSSIEAWFQKKERDIMIANDRLMRNPSLLTEREIMKNGVSSPYHNTRMSNLTLTPNITVRTMARDFAEKLKRGI